MDERSDVRDDDAEYARLGRRTLWLATGAIAFGLVIFYVLFLVDVD